MSDSIQFKDAIRWVYRRRADGKSGALVLQVMVLETNLDTNGQGDVNQKWVDVPLVDEATGKQIDNIP